MSEEVSIYSKVLVHESDTDVIAQIKAFCDENSLIGMLDLSHDILDVVKGNIDLGAIFMNNDTVKGVSAAEIARKIQQYRPEIPVFLRVTGETEDLGISEAEEGILFAGTYTLSNLSKLQELVNSYVFSMHYPPALVRGIQEISEKSLVSSFKNSNLIMGHPSIVRDKTIFGEILSLIELESSWCRGYMMLQVDKPGIVESIRSGRTALTTDQAEARGIDSMLSEITNLIWGGIKARFFTSSSEKTESLYRVQVPIVVNHVDKYVTFGSDQPQLCIRYELEDQDNSDSIITIYQRFVFNMTWSPELFKESDMEINALVNTGELEFF